MPVAPPQQQQQQQQQQQRQPAQNPLQPVYAPNAPYGQATYSNAPTALSNQQIGALSPQATIQQILAGFQPQARQSTAALNQTLAAAGIAGGGAQGAQQLLQGQLASSLAPTLASAIQNAQQNTLGAQEFGVSTGLQQSLANAGAANNMTGLNLQNTMATNFANQGAANTAGTNLAQMLQQGWQVPLEAYSGLQSSALGSAGSLAGQEAQNFPVYQQQQPWYSTLFQAAGAAAPYAEMAAGG
jgi:hypothetical protein